MTKKAPKSLLLVSCFGLCGCSSLPMYRAKGPLAVSIDIDSSSGNGVVGIKKLTSDCRDEARFENMIGKNTKTIFVDAEDKFTFQLIYFSPLNVGCKLQNSFVMKYGDSYKISITPPPGGASKDQSCELSISVRPYDSSVFGGMFGEWQPAKFEGTCSINQRF